MIPMSKLLSLTFLLIITSCSQSIDQKTKSALIKGHSGTCIPTIQTQYTKMGVDSQSTEVITSIKEYCSCLGHKYFDNFTKEDNQWLIKNGSLPPRIASKRSQYQMQCWE